MALVAARRRCGGGSNGLADNPSPLRPGSAIGGSSALSSHKTRWRNSNLSRHFYSRYTTPDWRASGNTSAASHGTIWTKFFLPDVGVVWIWAAAPDGTAKSSKTVVIVGWDSIVAPAIHSTRSCTPTARRCRSVREKRPAAVAWQALEYLENPQEFINEVARVLEVGGVFCGSISFLEPLHGRSYWGISEAGIRLLLERAGFKDVEVRPGLSGFALLLWTWLRRLAGVQAERLALPIVATLCAGPAAAAFFFSWLKSRLGWGSGHIMTWLVDRAPLEFAGHLMFVARKPGRR